MTESEAVDRYCPACGSNDTESVELERHRGPASAGLYETLACNDCYAGFRVEYEPTEKELTTEPEVEP